MANSRKRIQMVDLGGQYLKIKNEIDAAISNVLESCAFINGPQVKQFAAHLAEYLGVKYVIPCANGTDALQISLMALELKPGDEVIVPAFTYVATAEVIGLLGLTPVMVDVDYSTFNTTLKNIERALTSKTKAIVPVHLFGQSCDMEPILNFAREHSLHVVEDNAQALGAEYTFSNGVKCKTGTMGTIGCTSFFPSKNLGCYGDGGAIMTNDDLLAQRLAMIANHGQKVKYHHSVIGCNSRLDTIQAAILDVKLKYLDNYCMARRTAAQYYTSKLQEFDPQQRYFELPQVAPNSTHVYHQYTLKIKGGMRDALKEYLAGHGVPCMVYYPLPLQAQEAFEGIAVAAEKLDIAEKLSESVLSLPIHTELDYETQDFIIERIKEFYSK